MTAKVFLLPIQLDVILSKRYLQVVSCFIQAQRTTAEHVDIKDFNSIRSVAVNGEDHPGDSF
jgi:hypothetical protein